ncbi:hypothetical protein [Streptomyces niveus]|uniref:ESX-1 secretion-associated protein n=1 Tax=Streptomyces niveus TaxID=193462 RepID=A0A1U9QRV0_STRNV|nr:hypothetical protein [Streptomyces niveus]AQU66972.1 hypothetical protein BBN63_12720 [Streptomyces niveus]
MSTEPSSDAQLPDLPLPPGARGPLEPLPLGVPAPGFGDRLVIAEGVLIKAAGVADEVLDAFHGPAGSVREPAAKAAGELAGWESAAALRTSLKNWENQARTAEGWLARISESLRASSHAYTGTEQGIEQQFSALRGLK